MYWTRFSLHSLIEEGTKMNDVIIVGGSFAGFSAAMQLVRGHRQVTVIDCSAPRNRFAVKSHGFFGLDNITPAEIREKAIAQLARYPTFHLVAGLATTAEKTTDGFEVKLADGGSVTGKLLILATGLRDEIPDLPGLRERWGKTAIHCPYCHGYELSHRPLGVLATHPLSVHQASIIPDWGPTTFFTQGEFTISADDEVILKRRGVVIETTPVVAVQGNSPDISAVELADGRLIPIEALYVAPKTSMSSPLAEQLGCEFEEGPTGSFVKVDMVKQTSVAGVFAAGDMSNPMQNATLASASGVMAGVGAHRSLMFD